MSTAAPRAAPAPVVEERSHGVYSIGAASSMLGVPPGTLRTWEERYRVISPERTRAGHRLYTREQLGQLRFVVSETRRGMSAADAHRALAQGSVGPSHGSGTRLKLLILVAERDPYSAELIESLLKTEGFGVEVALDVHEARARFERTRPDLTVIELLMGGGAGLELCRWLRERATAPLLMISALAASDRALEAGADAFLRKPIGHLQLISAVKDLLGLSAMLSEPR
jgi:CheY-like chemotaxis protein